MENPLAYWALLNEKADRRYERHAFTLEELGRLLAAAEAGPVVHGMTGADRVLLYRTAVETGFRWSELRSLTRTSFYFADDGASVTIAAAYAKNGKEDTLPLRPELAVDLEKRMALFLPTAKAFPGMWVGKGAEMIRVDLEAGGVLARNTDNALTVTDEFGLVYDFHSLRATFATLLNKARVPLATAQRLMRHSDPKLTAGIYTHVLLTDKAEELAKLPKIAAMTQDRHAESTQKTGTDDTPAPVENKDRKRDSFPTNSHGQIRTCVDGEKTVNHPFAEASGSKTPLSPNGKQGVDMWSQLRDSNPGPVLYESTALPLSQVGAANGYRLSCTKIIRRCKRFLQSFNSCSMNVDPPGGFHKMDDILKRAEISVFRSPNLMRASGLGLTFPEISNVTGIQYERRAIGPRRQYSTFIVHFPREFPRRSGFAYAVLPTPVPGPAPHGGRLRRRRPALRRFPRFSRRLRPTPPRIRPGEGKTAPHRPTRSRNHRHCTGKTVQTRGRAHPRPGLLLLLAQSRRSRHGDESRLDIAGRLPHFRTGMADAATLPQRRHDLLRL